MKKKKNVTGTKVPVNLLFCLLFFVSKRLSNLVERIDIMKVQELFDIDRFVKVNDLGEVKSQHIYKTQSQFNPEGLFSEEIFGQTIEERKYRCGYIKLPVHVFNPCVAKVIISRSGGIIRKMAYGETKCNLVNGVLVADKNGEYCGLKDLYNIWEKIDIRKTLSTRSQDNIDILTKCPKRLLFNDKVLVLPPGFREIGMRNGRRTKNELNTLYSHIIGLKSVTSHTTANVYQIYAKFQDAVMNIYTYIHDYVGSKNGFFQKQLLAKTTTFTARNVISAPRYNTDDPEIGIFRSGFPLHTCVSLFKPLVKFQMKQFFTFSNIQDIHPNKEEVNIENITNIYDNKMIDDLCNIYMKNPGSRFRIIYLDPENTVPLQMEYMDVKKNVKVTRPMTLTDVIYLCCKVAIVDANRTVYTVRYPIGDYLGAFFSKVHILSTVDTMKIEFRGETFKSYPIVNPDAPHSRVAISFADTMTPSNSRLKAIGGDYDGDTVKSIGLWSDEANQRAEELMYSKIYNIKAECDSVYDIAIECLNGLYALTRRKNK